MKINNQKNQQLSCLKTLSLQFNCVHKLEEIILNIGLLKQFVFFLLQYLIKINNTEQKSRDKLVKFYKYRNYHMTTTFSSLNQSSLTNSSLKAQKENFPARIDNLSRNLEQIQKRIKTLKEQEQSVRQAKINVQKYLDQKSEQNKQKLIGQLKRYQDEIKRKIQATKTETEKIEEKITTMKNGQLQTLQLILGIQRRVQQLQVQLGLQLEQ